MKKRINFIKISQKSLYFFYILNKRNKDIKNKKKITFFFLKYLRFFKFIFLKNHLNFLKYLNLKNNLNFNFVGLHKEVNLTYKYNKQYVKYKMKVEEVNSFTDLNLNFYIYLNNIYYLKKLLLVLNKNYMLLVKKKPINNGSRWVNLYKSFLDKKKINNVYNLKNKSGRNNTGSITVRHRRSIKTFSVKFLCNYYSNFLIVSSFFNLKRRFYPVMELVDYNKNYYYSRRISGLIIGDILKNFPLFINNEFNEAIGYNVLLHKLPLGFIFCNLSSQLTFKKVACSSGTYCVIILNDINSSLIKILLPSGKYKILNQSYTCSIGRISNENYKNCNFGKAGNVFNQGFRSTVRGVAMNPIDHPHGGRTKTNSPEKSPWGWVTKYNK